MGARCIEDTTVNVLLIAIDTLRADHLGVYGYHRKTSPNIDAFASKAAVFERAFATAIPTHPAFATICSGQYSITHTIVAHAAKSPVPRTTPWLPEILQRYGYTTCALDNLAPWRYGFGRGYEFYIDPTSRKNLAINCDNREINRRAIPWLEQHAHEKFFMFIHYWDPHTPYLPPRAYRTLFYKGNPHQPDNHAMDHFTDHPLGKTWSETWFKKLPPHITDPEYLVALYDAEIRYCDEGIRTLLDTLDASGKAEDTLVILLSDHGEMMYKHGIFFDHHGLYDGNIHVPWIVSHPSISPRRIPYLAEHVDVAPTILDLCGVPVPPEMEGKSWAPFLLGKGEPVQRDFVVSQECTWQMKWCIRTENHKLILAREPDFYNTPMKELYDLQADPEELHNIAEQEPERVRYLENKLEEWIAAMMKKNNLTQDPLVAHGLTLGMQWKEARAQSARRD